MLPEVEKYFADLDVVDKATSAALAEVVANYPVPEPVSGPAGTDWTAYDRALEARRPHEIEVYNRGDNGRNKARATLVETTRDPLVKWIAEDVLSRYREHSEQILKQLTEDASNRYAELSAFANGRGWCNVFSQLRTAAVRAGALEDTRTPLDRLRTRVVSSGGQYTWDEMQRALQTYVADERDKAVAEYVAARAANPFQDTTAGEDA